MISVEALKKEYRVHERPLASSRQRDRSSIGNTRRSQRSTGSPSRLLRGSASVDGHEPRLRQDAFLKKIMLVLGQKQQLIWDLPPSETFELNRAIYEVPMSEYRRTMDELTDRPGLGELVSKPTRQLSLGDPHAHRPKEPLPRRSDERVLHPHPKNGNAVSVC